MSDITTAYVLGQYRRELESEGFTPDDAVRLVRDAALTVHRRDGVQVKPPEPSVGPFSVATATASERFNAAIAYRSLQQLLIALQDAAKKGGDR